MTTSWRRDPASVLDWAWPWGPHDGEPGWLAEDETIDTATVTITAGPIDDDTPLTIDSVTNTDTVVTAWVSGGVVGDRNKLTCHIVTNQGRTDERSLTLHTAER